LQFKSWGYNLWVFLKRAVTIEPGFSRVGKSLRSTDPQILSERPLRALQLACEQSLTLEPQTQSTLKELRITPLEVAGDFAALMLMPYASRLVRLMSDTGMLEQVMPELEACRGVEQFGGFHHLDVFDHSLEALERLNATFESAKLETRLATLLHDIGKPAAKNWDVVRERWSFFAHDQIGAKIARALLTRFGYDERLIHRTSSMVDRHMLRLPGDETTAARFVRRNTEILPELLEVMLADREAARGPASDEGSRRSYQHGFELVLNAMKANSSIKVLMNGSEIMEFLQLKPGVAVGRALEFLKTLQESGEVEDLEAAKRALLQWRQIRDSSAGKLEQPAD
jgi:poly(A) polymerase